MSVLGGNTDQALLDYMGHNLLSNSKKLSSKKDSQGVFFSAETADLQLVCPTCQTQGLYNPQHTPKNWWCKMFIAQH